MSAAVWTGPIAVAAGLLVVAGGAKTLRPDETATALRALGISAPRSAVRAAAAAEAGLGLWVLGWSTPAGLVALGVSYLGFAGFVAVALARRLPIASCGCFGRPDTPPTLLHVGVDLAAALAAFAGAASASPDLPSVVGDQPLAGLPYLVLVATGVALAGAALAWLPRLHALRSEARLSEEPAR